MKIVLVVAQDVVHPLAWHLAQDVAVDRIFVVGGNGGTALEHKVENIDLVGAELVAWARQQQITLVISDQAVDDFAAQGIPVLGPTAACLAWSESLTPEILQTACIATVPLQEMAVNQTVLDSLHQQHRPFLVSVRPYQKTPFLIDKQSDLDVYWQTSACQQEQIWLETLADDYITLTGLVRGQQYLPLGSARVLLRREVAHQGEMTAGMGAYALLEEALQTHLMTDLIQPFLSLVQHQGVQYQGFMSFEFAQIQGAWVLRAAHFGLTAPSVALLMLRVQQGLAVNLHACSQEHFEPMALQWDTRHAVTVALVAKEYPHEASSPQTVTGNINFPSRNSKVFHCQTKIIDTHIVTAGNYLFHVSALGVTLDAARRQAYALINHINSTNIEYRHDIGYQAKRA